MFVDIDTANAEVYLWELIKAKKFQSIFLGICFNINTYEIFFAYDETGGILLAFQS